MAFPSKQYLSDRDIGFWRAYVEIMSERTYLVDRWSDGHTTWHPRVVQKLLWYSGYADTVRNRALAYNWLMANAAEPLRPLPCISID